jgi:hypothetical protein
MRKDVIPHGGKRKLRVRQNNVIEEVVARKSIELAGKLDIPTAKSYKTLYLDGGKPVKRDD